MASAGTPRFPAPAVTFRVFRSRSFAWALSALHCTTLINLLAWIFWAATPAVTVLAFALLIWVLSVLLSVRAFHRFLVGELVWDAQCWGFKCVDRSSGRDTDTLGTAVEVAFDVQSCMLLHFPKAQCFQWVLVHRRDAPSQWLELRRAVYSPPMAVQLPSRPHEFGIVPPA